MAGERRAGQAGRLGRDCAAASENLGDVEHRRLLRGLGPDSGNQWTMCFNLRTKKMSKLIVKKVAIMSFSNTCIPINATSHGHKLEGKAGILHFVESI